MFPFSHHGIYAREVSGQVLKIEFLLYLYMQYLDSMILFLTNSFQVIIHIYWAHIELQQLTLKVDHLPKRRFHSCGHLRIRTVFWWHHLGNRPRLFLTRNARRSTCKMMNQIFLFYLENPMHRKYLNSSNCNLIWE